MQRLLAISWLTLKAAFRFRLVLVLALVLFAGVVLLPLSIRDVGTARGFTQLLLTYTLAFMTSVLGFATLWLACGTLARDVEECQIQMVAVKPVPRWQIWLGKWLGIVALNAILLGLAAAAVFFLMQWRAQRLPPEEQTILRNEVMVARGSAKPPVPDIEATVEAELKRRIAASPEPLTDLAYMRQLIREQLKAQLQVVPPEMYRTWVIDLGWAKNFLQDQPLYIRAKFNTAQTSPSQTYLAMWAVGQMESARLYRTNMSLAADTFHEFMVPANLFDENGVLSIHFLNNNPAALLFPVEDGIEVLYREGGFALNFVRGVLIIFFWLTLLAAIGLTASSFLSFPVAAFVSLGILVVGFSTGTISLILEQGTVFEVNHETGVADEPTMIDRVALPVFRGLLFVINLVRGFSPIDSLSTGRSVSWSQLGLAFVQICILFGGFFSAIGMSILTRRELATAQNSP